MQPAATRLTGVHVHPVRGTRRPPVGRLTMDMSLIDVTAPRGKVELGDELTLAGEPGSQALTAEELATRLATINCEITTRIGQRVPRIAVGG